MTSMMMMTIMSAHEEGNTISLSQVQAFMETARPQTPADEVSKPTVSESAMAWLSNWNKEKKR